MRSKWERESFTTIKSLSQGFIHIWALSLKICVGISFFKRESSAISALSSTKSVLGGGNELIEEEGKKRYEPTDIDVVAFSTSEKQYLVGECKFKNEEFNKGNYDDLVRRSALIPTKYHRVAPFLLFSLSSFTSWVKENAKDAKLMTLEDLYSLDSLSA